MLAIDPKTLTRQENYKILIGSVIPRPIAFVTSLSKSGVLNGAPFSFFNVASSNPPLVTIAVGRRNGEPKDTARNIRDTGSFVVHIADESYLGKLNETAASLPPDESEVEHAGLTPVASAKIPVPGVAEARIRMECVLEQAILLQGDGGELVTDLIVGRVVCYHIDERLYEDGRIDAKKLKPVSRLAGYDYGFLGEIRTVARPD